MKSAVLTLALVLATAASAQAPAADAAARSEQVAYADLDLSSAAAQPAIEERVRAAANRVCDLGGMQALEDFSASSNCFRKAVAGGLHQRDQLVAAKRGSAIVAASALIINAK
jgi:UrcA family protein